MRTESVRSYMLWSYCISRSLSGQILSCAQAEEVGCALTWTMDNIARYGGDPRRIFLAGHSSGEGLLNSRLLMESDSV